MSCIFLALSSHEQCRGVLATGRTAVVEARFRLPSIVIDQSDDSIRSPPSPLRQAWLRCLPYGDEGRDANPDPDERKEPRRDTPEGAPICPNAQPEMEDAVAFGVVNGTAEEPRLAYLSEPQPITDELLALSEPVKPTKVFRFAELCAGRACRHFDGAECRFAKRVTRLLPTVVDKLPPCRLQPKF